MLVFIDESGDPGFNVKRGSTPIFAAAMAIFDSAEEALETDRVIRKAMVDLNTYPEFHFTKCSNLVRDGFFNAVQGCPFLVRAIVVRKNIIYSEHLRSEKEDFYRFFIRKMLENDNGTLESAKVIIDGSGDRQFRQMLKRSLKRQVGAGVKDIRFARSESDPLVQLADMCVGAIARSYRTDRKDANRWRKMLRPRINDVWDFM